MDSNTPVEIKNIAWESEGKEGCYRVVLGDEAGTFTVPVIIGSYDAVPVLDVFYNKRLTRPHPFDLFASFIELSGSKLDGASIVSFDKGVFYTELLFTCRSGSLKLDSRVSDALALALRCGATVSMRDSLIAELGEFRNPDGTARTADTRVELLHLEKKLEQLVVSECYEEAAVVRDRIKSLEKG